MSACTCETPKLGGCILHGGNRVGPANGDRDQHIWDLYHALNIALPTYSYPGDDLDSVPGIAHPPSTVMVDAASDTLTKHHECCGAVYDAGWRALIEKAVAGDRSTLVGRILTGDDEGSP